MGSEDFRAKFFKIFLAVSSYWLVSISLVFLNKWLLSNNDLEIPTFVTWFQCVVTIFCICFSTIFSLQRHNSIIQNFKINVLDFFSASFLSVIFSAMVVFNNYTLKLVPVSFYNVARSLTTFFNMIFTIIILKKPICYKSAICCALVIMGFIIGVENSHISSKQEYYMVVLMGVTSSLFVSLYAIFMKTSLEQFNGNVLKLQFVVNVESSIILFPLVILLGDHSSIINSFHNTLYSLSFWFSVILSGVFGYFIGICTLFQIKYTSPLTHNISGTAKACIQTVLAVIISKETHTLQWWLGNALVLIGSGMYSYVRTLNMKSEGK